MGAGKTFAKVAAIGAAIAGRDLLLAQAAGARSGRGDNSDVPARRGPPRRRRLSRPTERFDVHG